MRSKNSARYFFVRLKYPIFLIVILAFLNFAPVNKGIKNSFYMVSSPAQSFFWRTGDGLSDFFNTIFSFNNLKKENEDFRLKIQALYVRNAGLEALEGENKILREALGIGLQEAFNIKMARITGKDIFQDSLMIDKGSKDGVEENAPVVTSKKVVCGKIIDVNNNFSTVMLITNSKSAFDVAIENTKENNSGVVMGVAKGKGNFQLYLDLIPKDKIIENGDIAITASLGGIFPNGLLVGEVMNIKKDDTKPWQTAEIKPACDVSELYELFILSPR